MGGYVPYEYAEHRFGDSYGPGVHAARPPLHLTRGDIYGVAPPPAASDSGEAVLCVSLAWFWRSYVLILNGWISGAGLSHFSKLLLLFIFVSYRLVWSIDVSLPCICIQFRQKKNLYTIDIAFYFHQQVELDVLARAQLAHV